MIETILFCAEQELPLRGDNDSGTLGLEKPPVRDGKFEIFAELKKNAMYVSPHIQNEIGSSKQNRSWYNLKRIGK